jgi:uncharacterized protein YqfA (UPF0365 family)
MMERAAYDALQKSKRAKIVSASFVKGVAGKGVSYDALERMAIEAAQHLIDEGAMQDEAAEFYGTDASFLGRSLVGLLYVHALAR